MMVVNKAKYEEIGQLIRGIPPEKPFSSYEWEELVQKLCDSNDDGLRDIGAKELYDLLHKRPVNGGM